MLHAEPVQPEAAVDSDERTHRLLAAANARRFAPRRSAGDFDAELNQEAAIRRTERSFIEAERAAVKAEARATPDDPSAFVAWFQSLTETHAASTQALSSWLESDANVQQSQWFAARERCHDAAFEDLLALTRVNLSEHSKHELIRHWAELSHAGPARLFSPRPAAPEISVPEPAIWEALAVDNLMVALATARHYVYQSLGALGLVEPISGGRRQSALWGRDVFFPLLSHDASLAPLVAEGALMRLRLVARRDARYLQLLAHSCSPVAQFEFAEESSPPAARHEPSSGAAVRPVQWRDVTARPPH